MNEQELNQRILAAKERAAGRPADFPMIVEQGKEVEQKRARNDGRVDVTVPSAMPPTEKDMRGRIPDDYIAPDNSPVEPLKIAGLVLYRSGLTGFEKVLTKGRSDWELHYPDGRVEHDPNTILKALHTEGRRISAEKVGK